MGLTSEQITRAVGSQPKEQQGRLLRIGRWIQSTEHPRLCSTPSLVNRDCKKSRRKAIAIVAKDLRRVGMISGFELLLIRMGLSVLFRFLETILFDVQSRIAK